MIQTVGAAASPWGSGSLLPLALKTWKKMGERQGEGEEKGANGVAYRIVKNDKMVVVRPSDAEILNRITKQGKKKLSAFVEIIAFPHPDHVEAFQNAAGVLALEGPSDRNTGAIGTLQLRLSRKIRKENRFLNLPKVSNNPVELQLAQAHYKTKPKKPPTKGAPNEEWFEKAIASAGLLDRRVAFEYVNWRIPCIREAVRIAQKLGRDMVMVHGMYDNDIRWVNKKGQTAFQKEVRKVCDELGAKVIEHKGNLVLIKPKKSSLMSRILRAKTGV